MTEHPITPTAELVQQWLGSHFGTTVTGEVSEVELALATQAANWGANQELEACVEWIAGQDWTWTSAQLRAARRPRAPSLKEQALTQTNAILNDPKRVLLTEVRKTFELYRRALERLQELEEQGDG